MTEPQPPASPAGIPKASAENGPVWENLPPQDLDLLKSILASDEAAEPSWRDSLRVAWMAGAVCLLAATLLVLSIDHPLSVRDVLVFGCGVVVAGALAGALYAGRKTLVGLLSRRFPSTATSLGLSRREVSRARTALTRKRWLEKPVAHAITLLCVAFFTFWTCAETGKPPRDAPHELQPAS